MYVYYIFDLLGVDAYNEIYNGKCNLLSVVLLQLLDLIDTSLKTDTLYKFL